MIHKAKKSLGQNFLKSSLAIKKIIEAGEISRDNIILEIGPGKGALTEKLLENSRTVIAFEKDNNLFQLLNEKFENEVKNGKLVIANEDILDFDTNAYGLKSNAYKIIANIPYNITGAILKKFLTEKNQPERMILMVQNEVAQRILAKDGKESILSISVKAYGEPKVVMKVAARYFSPVPKVDSAVIAIKNISRKVFVENNLDEEEFWEIIRAGFAHKRKKLSSNLKNALKNQNETSKSALSVLKDKRAEELSLTEWINFIKTLDINNKN